MIPMETLLKLQISEHVIVLSICRENSGLLHQLSVTCMLQLEIKSPSFVTSVSHETTAYDLGLANSVGEK